MLSVTNVAPLPAAEAHTERHSSAHREVFSNTGDDEIYTQNKVGFPL
jgi:hypothetical protein